MKSRMKKFIIAFLGVLLVLSLYNCVPTQELSDDQSNSRATSEEVLNRCKFKLSNGRQYMIQQSWTDALRNFKDILDMGCAEEFVDPLFKDMARCYMKLNQPDSAAHYIDMGLSYDATDKHLLQLSAYYKERSGDYEGAVNVYNRYNALYIDDVEYLTKEAEALDVLGEYQQELEVWEYILTVEPNNNKAINSIIQVLSKMGRDPREFYQKAWENDKTNASKALNYINALLNSNNYSDAIRVARESLQFNPQNVTMVKKLAECYEYNNEMPKSLEVLEDYARRNPRDINMQIDVAKLNVEFGNYQKAYNMITDAISLAPNNKELYEQRGKVLESYVEFITLEKGRVDINDKIVYHMAYEDYQKARQLGNMNAQFRIKYLYDNNLTIAKVQDRFLISDANKVNDNTYKALGDCYSWLDRTVTIE
jgi:tetratricopeptide (TPR) repeat protein